MAIAFREFFERRMLFAAAALVSVFPLLMPLVRGITGDPRAEAQELLSGILAIIVSVGLGILLGATLYHSGPIHRLGFYFARPVSTVTLWSGKLIGAAMLISGTAILVLVPGILWRGSYSGTATAFVDLNTLSMFVTALFFVPLIHLLTVLFRSRSWLLLIDIIGLVAAWLAMGLLQIRLSNMDAYLPISHATVFHGVVIVGGVFVSSLAAIHVGRLERGVAHAAVTVTMAAFLSFGLACVAGYTVWVGNARPADMDLVRIEDSAGSWIFLYGRARGSWPAFFYNLENGQYHKFDGVYDPNAVFAPDGSRAVRVMETSRHPREYQLSVWALNQKNTESVYTETFSQTPLAFLSPSGEWLATISNGILTVRRIGHPESEQVVRVRDKGQAIRGFFVDEENIRLYRFSANKRRTDSIDALAYSVETTSLTTLWSIPNARDWPRLDIDRAGKRIVYLDEQSRALQLLDGDTGEVLAELLPYAAPKSYPRGTLTADGSVVVAAAVEGSNQLIVFDREGTLQHTIPVDGNRGVSIGCEISTGELSLGLSRKEGDEIRMSAAVLDVHEGRIRALDEDLEPVCAARDYTREPNLQPDPGAPFTRLFRTANGTAIVDIEPSTGERRLLFGTLADERHGRDLSAGQ